MTRLPRFSTLNEVLQMSPGESESRFQAGEITSGCDCATVFRPLPDVTGVSQRAVPGNTKSAGLRKILREVRGRLKLKWK